MKSRLGLWHGGTAGTIQTECPQALVYLHRWTLQSRVSGVGNRGTRAQLNSKLCVAALALIACLHTYSALYQRDTIGSLKPSRISVGASRTHTHTHTDTHIRTHTRAHTHTHTHAHTHTLSYHTYTNIIYRYIYIYSFFSYSLWRIPSLRHQKSHQNVPHMSHMRLAGNG